MMTLNKTAMKWTPIMSHAIFLTKGKFLDGSRYGEQMIVGILSFFNQYRAVIKLAKKKVMIHPTRIIFKMRSLLLNLVCIGFLTTSNLAKGMAN